MPCGSITPSGQPVETRHLVVMGVTGVGKTAVARLLAAELDLTLAEGDDFHPTENVAKMSQGIPLTDADRQPWLEALADWTLQQRRANKSTVMTCSALRRSYRDVLRAAAPATFFVHLTGEEDLIRVRMEARRHFMPPTLLHSQLAILEPLEPDELGVSVDVSAPLDEVVDRIVTALPTA